MGSSSKTAANTTSDEYSDSLNSTLTNSVGQNGLGLTVGGSASNISLANYSNSFNSPTTLTITNSTSRSSNIGSGSASSSGASVSPSVSAGTSPSGSGFSLTGIAPWLLLGLAVIVAFLIVRKSG